MLVTQNKSTPNYLNFMKSKLQLLGIRRLAPKLVQCCSCSPVNVKVGCEGVGRLRRNIAECFARTAGESGEKKFEPHGPPFLFKRNTF